MKGLKTRKKGICYFVMYFFIIILYYIYTKVSQVNKYQLACL